MELVIIALVAALVWGIDLIVRRIRGVKKDARRGLTSEGLIACAILLWIGTSISWTVGIRNWTELNEKTLPVLFGFILPLVASIAVTSAAMVKIRKQSQERH